MSARSFFSFLKWAAILLVLGGLMSAAYLVQAKIKKGEAQDKDDWASEGADKDKDREPPDKAEKKVVKLDEEKGEALGLRVEPALSVSWSQQVPVYGRVVPNSQATAEVRTPFAGTLQADPDNPWPAPGRQVRAGQVLGRVAIRLGPQEQLDLQGKLNDARLKQHEAVEILKLRKERVDRLQKVTASEIVSRKELDDALVALAEAQTQAATTQATIDLLHNALGVKEGGKGQAVSTWTHPLTVPAAGEVTELAARPGMSVEAGNLIARVVDFNRPLVRLDIPPELLADGAPPQVELFAVLAGGAALDEPASAISAKPLAATLVGPAPEVELASQFSGCWYEVRGGKGETDSQAKNAGRVGWAWRPGLFVMAYMKVPGGRPGKAVAVPGTAILYHEGQPLVYVRTAPGEYQRRGVQLLGREGERCMLGAGIEAGDPVVSSQAQLLLSLEFLGTVDTD